MDPPQCQICLRPAGGQLLFNCPACARNVVYLSRLQHAQILISKEALGAEVEKALERSKDVSIQVAGKGDVDLSASRITIQRRKAQYAQAREKAQAYQAHVTVLREETVSMKADISERWAALSARKAALAVLREELAQREAASKEAMEKPTSKTGHHWDDLHTRTAESRIFLCREAANLYGLQQKRRKKGMPGRDAYFIGGVPIIDIRDINNASPAQISVSISHLAHLLHLTSHYLSLRLPAEIILPSPHRPHPIIYSPISSYNTPMIPIPGPKASLTTPASTTGKPRYLYLEKPVLTLATEDPIAYSLFIDAITLLAWDITWLCKTQGLDTGAKSWEDICAMGRNMWTLLVASPPPLRPIPARITRTVSRGNPSPGLNLLTIDPRSPKSPVLGDLAPPPPVPGHFSHSTAHSFLAGAEGAEYMRTWKLGNPVRIIERVKAALASERMGAEWEVLEEAEWENEGEAPGGKTKEEDEARAGQTQIGGAKGGEAVVAAEEGEKGKGRSGWMKVKSRGGDA